MSDDQRPRTNALLLSIGLLAAMMFGIGNGSARTQGPGLTPNTGSPATMALPPSVNALLSNATFAVRVTFPSSTSWDIAALKADAAYSDGVIDGGYLVVTNREFSAYQESIDPPNDTQIIPSGIPLQYAVGSDNSVYVSTSAALPQGYMALFGFPNTAAPLALHPGRSLSLTVPDFTTLWNGGIHYLSEYDDKYLSLAGIAMSLYKDWVAKGLVNGSLPDVDVLLKTEVDVLNNTGKRVVIVVARNMTDCLGAGPLPDDVANRWWPKGASDRCGSTEWSFDLDYTNLGSSWFAWSRANGDNGTLQTIRFDGAIRAQHSAYGGDSLYTTNPVALPHTISMAHTNVWSGNHDEVELVFQADDVTFTNVWESPQVGSPPAPIKAFIEPGWTIGGTPPGVLFQSDGSSLAPFSCAWGSPPATTSATDGNPEPSIRFDTAEAYSYVAAPFVLPHLLAGEVLHGSADVRFESGSDFYSHFGALMPPPCGYSETIMPVPQSVYIDSLKSFYVYGYHEPGVLTWKSTPLDLAPGTWHKVDFELWPTGTSGEYDFKFNIDDAHVFSGKSYYSLAPNAELGILIGDGGTGGACHINYDNIRVEILRGDPNEIDHFEFSTIDSPQAVGVMISNVKITAKSATGSPVILDGSVALGSSQGRVSPMTVKLVGGTATVDVKLSSPGNDVQLTATGVGVQGKSNTFSVTGGNNLGSLAGLVYDYVSGTASKVSGAQVQLHYGTTTLSATTTNGWYKFSRIPCGGYAATASYGGRSTAASVVIVPCEYRTATLDFVIPAACNAGGRTPVLLVPGIMGSTTYPNRLLPFLPATSPRWDDSAWPTREKRNPGGLVDALSLLGWSDLITLLEQSGYAWNCTLFAAPYDWRLTPSISARGYLKNHIDHAKQVAGSTSVDIIAHSMGGILSRIYVQGADYQEDVRKLAMVGTPNAGSEKAYFIWEGGDPDKADEIGGRPYVYADVSEEQWEVFTGLKWGKCDDTYNDQYRSKMRAFYGSHIPSIAWLLPTSRLFLRESDHTSRALIFDRNVGLETLNAPSAGRARLGSSSGSGTVEVRLFPGIGQPTVEEVLVGPAYNGEALYRDGIPRKPYYLLTGSPVASGDGDGTVLTDSVAPKEWASQVTTVNGLRQGSHAKLIGVYKADLVEFISGVRPAATAPHINAVPPPTLSVSILGSAQPYMTDAQGLGAGINPATESAEDAIAGSAVSAGIDEAAISIDNPADGTFNLALSAPSPQDYHLKIQYADSSGNQSLDEWLFNHGGTSHVTLTLNAASTSKIALSGLPAPPSGLVANAEGSGPRTTKLTWQPSPDSGVTYNVYSRKTDEPFLQSAGSTTATTLSLADPWAVDASVPTRIYAVAAARQDGTESFLSSHDFNNDRDHDGATDAEETARSTDPDNPDMDSDGFQDGDEAIRGTDPRNADTDLDGFLDGYEVKTGSDPLDVTSTPKPNGDASGDGYVTVADLFHLINYVFSPGAAPVNGADVNGDGILDAADVFYLINYLFSGGPAPK